MISGSRVPILKLKDNQKNIEIDICVNRMLGELNSKMLRAYGSLDHRIPPVIFALKKWAKAKGINDASTGTLSSYSYVLMGIFYLQCLNPPVLPSLQALGKKNPEACPHPHFCDTFDCRYFGDLDSPKVKDFGLMNESTVGGLVVGLFRFYSTFNFEKHTISIRAGRPIPKISAAKISIEDPFELRDLGNVVHPGKVARIIDEFKKAFELLRNQGSLQLLIGQWLPSSASQDKEEQATYEEHLPMHTALDMIKVGLSLPLPPSSPFSFI